MKLYGTSKNDLKTAVGDGDFSIAVYGLGKMGLPIAGVFAETFGSVTGVDIDREVVEAVSRGESHVKSEPGLDDLVEQTVDSGSLRATQDSGHAASEADIHVIIVPTLLDEQNRPDLSAVKSVLSDIATGLERGDMIFVESTVPPGTCAELVKPSLAEKSGIARDLFGVAFCPERTSSGRALKDIRGAYPKIVGGTDQESTTVASAVYEEINDAGKLAVTDAKTAETEKIFEGLFRDVNIALANEFAKFSDELDIDAWEAIEAANTVPFINIHDPGPGVGGHCIPYYPHFVLGEYESDLPLTETARLVNDGMPAYTVRRLTDLLSELDWQLADSTVAVLGLTYKPGVEEIRASPAIKISKLLQDEGSEVLVTDPLLSDFSAFYGQPIELSELYDRDPTAVIVVTPHDEFGDIQWERFEPMIIIDGRNTIQTESTEHIVVRIGGGRPSFDETVHPSAASK